MFARRFATAFSLCLIAASVQACTYMDEYTREVPQTQTSAEREQYPDLGERKAAIEPSQGVLTPEEQAAAIDELKRRNP